MTALKLQAASKKEILRIAIGTAVCTAVMFVVFFVLSLFDICTFDYQVILGGLGGGLVAVINFAALCLTVQSAAQMDEKKQMKAKIQVSYNLRLFLQAAWIVAAFLLPWFHVVAAALPLLFPTVVIYFLQARGKLVTPSHRKNPPQEPEQREERLDTFEA